MSIRLRALAVGVATYIPGVERLSGRKTGGTSSARYCYSVWLRHLSFLRRNCVPLGFETVVELGPGDTLGVGLAALMSGARQYIALDAVRYADRAANLRVFDELSALFRDRAEIPNDREFPRMWPALSSYAFPADLLTRQWLSRTLDRQRLDAIRASIEDPSNCPDGGGMVCYVAPWVPGAVRSGTVDLILSQSVLEYSLDLPALYAEMARWLKPAGFMSHEIDFKSFGLTTEWNGHWGCPAPLWQLAVGRRRHRLNREPCSTHVALAERVSCQVVHIERRVSASEILRTQLLDGYRNLTDDDLTTSSALIQSVKIADIS